MKLLTVTVPCYNSQDYMKTCIDSLLKGGDRVEIIIIDDGSIDETGRIADEYAATYPFIVKVIHQENGGHGEGINQGLRHATGKYFKVVDSDDCLSEDFIRFLDLLEECEQKGGVDLFVTNYFYNHSDGKGDKPIHYRRVLPIGRIFAWNETKRFRIHQLLTIHSCTFSTQLMRKSDTALPKNTFYEDNYMVYLHLPHVKKMYYMDSDLYRYTIGREGQSIQENITKTRYSHQLLVTQLCFRSCHLDEIAQPRLKQYMKHELFMMLGISTMFTRLNKTDETDEDLKRMWDNCGGFDAKYAKHFLKRSPLFFINLPGRFGRGFTCFVYRLANKIVRFN